MAGTRDCGHLRPPPCLKPCVRVPVFIGHAEAINLELEKPLTAEEARVLLRDAPGVAVVDHRQDEGIQEKDDVVSERIRQGVGIRIGSACGERNKETERPCPSRKESS